VISYRYHPNNDNEKERRKIERRKNSEGIYSEQMSVNSVERASMLDEIKKY